MAAEKLVLLAQDDKTVSLAVIPAAASEAAATFRLIVEQRYRYRCGGAGDDANDDVVDTMEDVACRVPAGELRAAAAVDRAFEDLIAKLDHPTLRPEVAPAAREAASRVRARCAEEPGAQLGGVEFLLRVEFVDSFEPEDEETGSDLELDEDSLERGCWSDGGDRRCDQDPAALVSDDDEDGAQFAARPYGGGALAREGGASDGTLLLSGFEARADGPELTSRDVRRLVRLAFDGGDVEGDGAPVSRVTRAVVLEQGLRSATARQQQPTSPRGMRTGW